MTLTIRGGATLDAPPPIAKITEEVFGKSLRILYVASTRHSGGLEVASIRLADLLMRTQPGRQEILFACRPDCYIDEQCRKIGIRTLPLTVRNSGDLSGVGRLAEIARAESIDIIHVHSRRDYVVAMLAVRRLRRTQTVSAVPKLLLHLHLMRPLGSPVFLCGFFFSRSVDRIIGVSGAVRDYLLRKHPQLRSEQVVVVPNSVELHKYQLSTEQRYTIRERHGIPATATVVGMVGRLDTKGQINAIKALQRIKRADVFLLLVGEAGKKGYREYLQRMVNKSGVSRQVIFCGSQENIAPYLSAMDIFAHLPREEAFGLAPAEAMAAGLPALVSNVGGCVELIQDRQTGLLTNPRDVEEIRAKLVELIDSTDMRERFAAAGSQFIRRRFTTQAQADALTDVYSQVVAHQAVP